MENWFAGMTSPEVPTMENFEALAYAMTYSRKASTSSDLTWGYNGGMWGGFTIADGTLTLANNATNYIVVNRSSGAISTSTSGTNWSDTENYGRVYQVVTASGLVTTVSDFRAGMYGVMGSVDTVAGSATEFVNVQTGTTYTYLSTDRAKLVTHSNASAIAGTLPQAGSAGFEDGFWMDVQNRGAGTLTITPATSTVDGASSLALTTGQGVRIVSDGTNWFTMRGAGSGGGGGGSVTQAIPIACSDEVTDLTTGTAKVTFRMPYAMTLTAVRASLTTAQGSGSIFTVDINQNGTSILSTKLTIDNTEKTSVTAATPPVISDTSLDDNAEMTIDIDQIGAAGARGLKVYLIGTVT